MKTTKKARKAGRAISRRSVIKGAAVFAGAAPFIIPSRAFSQQKVLTLLSWPGYAAPEGFGQLLRSCRAAHGSFTCVNLRFWPIDARFFGP